MSKLTKEYLNECFEYEDGELIWKERPRHHFNTDQGYNNFNNRWAGEQAGTLPNNDVNNYHLIGISSKTYKRSRLMYIFHYGDIPEGMQIDHKNGIRSDDRIQNLRCVDNNTNMVNKKKYKCNTSGINGVYIHPNKKKMYSSCARENKKQIQLYYGNDLDEAIKARLEWEHKNPHITDRHGK